MLHVHDHSLCSYSKDTKFDDLPQDMQAALMTLEAGIKKADTASDAVSVPSFNLESITESIKTLQAHLAVCETLYEQLSADCQRTSEETDEQVRYCDYLHRTLQGSRQLASDGKTVTGYTPVYSMSQHDERFVVNLVLERLISRRMGELEVAMASLKTLPLKKEEKKSSSEQGMIFKGTLKMQRSLTASIAKEHMQVSMEVDRLVRRFSAFRQRYGMKSF